MKNFYKNLVQSNLNGMLAKVLMTFAFALIVGSVSAQTISIQGVLRDPNGRSVEDGAYSVVFSIYDVNTGGAALWTDTYASLQTNHGVFQANLGENATLDGLAFDKSYYVGITVENFAEMTPRIQLTIYPYAKAILGQDNKFPSTGNIVLAKDSIIVKLGALKFEGADGRIVFNDGTSLNTANFGGPASGLLNPSSINLNADKDTLGIGAINFQIAGQTKALIDNNGNATFKRAMTVGEQNVQNGSIIIAGAASPSGQGGYIQLSAAQDFTANVLNYTLRSTGNNFDISKIDGGGVLSTLMAITPTGDMSLSGGLSAGNSLLTAAFLQSGLSTSLNTVLQPSYLQANNNGAASTLNLNPNGGLLTAYQSLVLGANDNRYGNIVLFGDGGGSAVGGRIAMYTAADHDGARDEWQILVENDYMKIYSSGLDVMQFTANGNIGVGTINPALDLAIGDNDTGIDWISDGKFYLTQNGNPALTINDNGNVGIGSTNPTEAKLVVLGSGTHIVGAYKYINGNSTSIGVQGGSISAPYGILTDSRLAALEINIFSDARIKKVLSKSDNAQDLKTISQIEIVNYDFIDNIKKGTKTHKKVIAQQVEEIFPNAVSQSSDFIPSVFEMSSKIKFDKDAKTLTISTSKNHEFEVGTITRLITDDGMLETEVTAILDENTFVINSEKAFSEVFVHGKKVDDFRSVDYDAISMLNVSATQELAKRSADQEERIAKLEAENAALKAKLAKVDILEARLNILMELQDKAAAKTTKIVLK